MTSIVGGGESMNDENAFLNGGGETAGIIAEFPWENTPLGPISGWPAYLKATCSLILRSPVPMVTLWGEDGIMIYNDAYSLFAGGRHPRLFGSKVRQGWPEVADFNDHVMKTCLSGETLRYQDQQLILYRHEGEPEQVWMNLDYSPLLDDQGTPVGVIAIVVETTGKVRAEQRLNSEKDRLRQMFEQAPGFVATLVGPDHVFEIANNAYRELVDNREIIGLPLREALPEVAEQGVLELLDGVLKSRVPYVGRSFRVLLNRQGEALADERFLDFIYQPVFNDWGESTGIFVQGHDVTEQKLTEDALRDSETRFRLVAQDAPVMLWMTNEEGRCIYLNTAQRQFWGLSADDPADFDWQAMLHPDDRGSVLSQEHRDNRSRDARSFEFRMRDASGRYRVIQTRSQPRFGGNGEYLGLIGVNVDVTELKAEETRRAALIELNDRFRTLEDPRDIAFAAAEMLANVMRVSRAGYGTIDSTNETITIEKDWNAPGIKSLAGTLHFRDYGSYIEDLKRGDTVIVEDAYHDPRTAPTADALKGISAQSFINMPVTEREGLVALLYLNHEDAREWSSEDISFIRDVAERTRGVSERRRVEQEIKQFAALLEQQVIERTAELDRIWRNSRDLLVVLNDDGVIRSVNPAWTGALGYSPREVLGESFREFIWPDEQLEINFDPTLDGPKPFFIDQQIRFRHKDGSARWIDWRMTMEGQLLFAYGRDITAEREQSEALVHAETQLR